MKDFWRIVLFIIILDLLIGCKPDTSITYSIVYEVHYPSRVETFTATNHRGFYWGSDRGSNYVKNGKSITSYSIIDTSAPIKVVSYTSNKTN